jgi:trans-2,3-dihydro-3-hydroxyanthranilate isomerase
VGRDFEPIARFDPLAAGERAQSPEGARRYIVLDVFTDVPLGGNPLAVFPDGRGLEEELMQRLARELNLSETVFLLPAASAGAHARARIFTPAVELPFAGHPVLGSAIVVAQALASDAIVLETGAGEVPVEVRPGDGAAFGRMRQPLPTIAPFAQEAELLAALGIERSLLPVELYDNGPRHVYVALESEERVAALRPDMRALEALGPIDANCFAGSGASYRTRMFAPLFGVPEDPATGSAAGPLALHLARHGRIAFGEEIQIRQGEEIGRPSLLLARALGTRELLERVEVAGNAVILAVAHLRPL